MPDNSDVDFHVGDRVESPTGKKGTIRGIRFESGYRILDVEFDCGLRHERSDTTIHRMG